MMMIIVIIPQPAWRKTFLGNEPRNKEDVEDFTTK